MKTTTLAVLIFGISLATCVSAQPDPPDTGQPADQGVDRGVARVSLINGDVSVQRGDSGDWVAAAVNAPVMANDTVFAGSGSRAELQFDYANMLRLGSDSELHLAELDNQRYLLQLGRGIVTFRVLRPSNADVEISTPSISVRPRGVGIYRIEVQPDGVTSVTVRAGQAEIFSPRGAQTISAGRAVLVRGDPSNPEFQVVSAAAPDDWDRWNQARDRDLMATQSYQYVSPDVYGADDLDAYGSWVPDATYGTVWSPRVAVGWTPYSSGRWMWGDYYGWTWISYDPWGWAPYHYGRWFYAPARGWCWWPGGRGRHAWSPALVAFVGFGGGAGSGFGRVGWVPLAPHEPFHRWWGHGAYGGATIVNNVNIYNSYRNARVANSVVAMNANDFGRGRGGNFFRAGRNDLQQARFVRGQLPITPNRDSLRMANRSVRTQDLPRNFGNTSFFSHRQPAGVRQPSFAEQRNRMEQRFGAEGSAFRPSGDSPARGPGFSGWRQVGQGAATTPGSAVAGAGPAVNQRGRNGWRGFGSQSSDPAAAAPAAPATGNWDRFNRSPRISTAQPRQENPNRGWDRPAGDQRRGADPGVNSQRRWIGSGSQPLRINPPMVHQRTETPRNYTAPQREFNNPGWRQSAPAMRAPRMESREVNRGSSGGGFRAPRMSSGGGFHGGGFHGGGGGGGERSGGGGRRR